MKRIFAAGLLFATIVLGSFHAKAQSGNDIALGLRFCPDGAGFTGKFFLDKDFAIEAQLNAGGVFNDPGVAAVGMAEYHVALPADGFRMFFGGGFHFGSWDRNDNNNREGIFGLDGIIGAEYLFKNIPLGVSVDFKPAVNFVSHVDFYPNNFFGVAGRFYLPVSKKK